MTFLIYLLYATLIRFLSIILVWHPKVRERLIFETKNIREDLARSFKLDKLKADLCFEFSSEGEYQQVASLIQDALTAGKKLELVFFSPSVEKAIVELAARYPQQIRYLRFPLLRGDFLKWITSTELILVRYDLFPEFLVWASSRKKQLKMIWVTFKSSRLKGKGLSFFKRMFLKASDQIIYASEEDRAFGESHGFKGLVYDFRIDQIGRRVSQKDEKFEKVFFHYPALKAQLKQYPREKRIIVGNAWPSDLFLLKEIPADYYLMVVPHKLEADILQAFQEGLKNFNRQVFLSNGDEIKDTRTMILNKKGVLCELYADFGKAYVGGGFEASIHSVLEPLVAGSDDLACGTKNQRSTEFDIAKGMGMITEVNSSDEFLAWVLKKSPEKNPDDLKAFFGKYSDYKKDIISC